MCWNIITAPRVITLAWPGRQSFCSSLGVLRKRQEKCPGGGARAATSSAPSELETAFALGLPVERAGSRAGPAAAAAAASSPPGTCQRSVLVELRRRSGPRGGPARGSTTCTSVPSPKPSPRGRKASVCASSSRQLPGSAGESRGRRLPSTSATGLENVSVNSRFGPISVPGVGLASSCGYGRAGNQFTRTGADGRSQVRAATATSTAPVGCVPLATRPIGTAALAAGRAGAAACPRARRRSRPCRTRP